MDWMAYKHHGRPHKHQHHSLSLLFVTRCCKTMRRICHDFTGPLYFEYVPYNGSLPNLKLRQHSWTKISSIIFLDSPVWTGFSYSSDSKVDLNGDMKSSKEVDQFLKKWLTDHPQFLSNPLYIAGDSYCGLTVPVVVHEIANGIDAGQKPILNLKGYFLGNPKTDRVIDEGSFVPYAHGMGLISDELYESTKKSCKGVYAKATNLKCSKALEAVNECISGLETVHILERKCPFASPKPRDTLGHGRSLKENYRELVLPDPLPTFGCRKYGYLHSYYWANDASVRKALHVREWTISEWQRCVSDLPFNEDLKSSVKYHPNLIARGYRALIYGGDHDLKVPFVGTETWIRSLNLSIIDDWRPWFVDDQIAGYTRTYSNDFTFATVKGAGHTAPEYKPKECFAMLQRWISHNSL